MDLLRRRRGRGRGGIRGVGSVCFVKAELVLEGVLALHPHHVALIQQGIHLDSKWEPEPEGNRRSLRIQLTLHLPAALLPIRRGRRPPRSASPSPASTDPPPPWLMISASVAGGGCPLRMSRAGRCGGQEPPMGTERKTHFWASLGRAGPSRWQNHKPAENKSSQQHPYLGFL